MSEGQSPNNQGGSNKNLLFILMGLLFIGFFLICLTTQVQTNEARVTGEAAVNLYKPNWVIFAQPFYLVMGQLSVSEAIATIVGWGVELIYLSFTVAGYEIIKNSAHRSGRIIGVMFELGAIGMCWFNWSNDYQYGTIGGGDWGHFWFALLTAFVVGYFGTIGLLLIKLGWSRA